ncbi:MAG: DUF2474 family protein [Sphingobium sp.]|nr:DUF2474 family protein [Sphingobium sp.]
MPDAAPWWKRLGWFAAIWIMSVAAIAAIAAVLRFWLAP